MTTKAKIIERFTILAAFSRLLYGQVYQFNRVSYSIILLLFNTTNKNKNNNKHFIAMLLVIYSIPSIKCDETKKATDGTRKYYTAHVRANKQAYYILSKGSMFVT